MHYTLWSTPHGTGAATSMEDGAFLVKCVGKIIDGTLRIEEAVKIYEEERMRKGYMKQQASFINSAIWHLPDGPQQQARDAPMSAELDGKYYVRSGTMYGDPQTVLDVYGYDAEEHADAALARYTTGKQAPVDPETGVDLTLQQRYMDWFIDEASVEDYVHQAAKRTSFQGSKL